MVMNKALQIETIKRLLEKNGIDPQTVDIEHLEETDLSLPENIKNIEEQLGINLKEKNGIYFDGAVIETDESGVKVKAMYNEEDGVVVTNDDNEEEREETDEKEEVTGDDIESEIDKLFTEVLEQTDPLEFFSKYLFPEIVGEQYEPIRKAILLMLATHSDMRKRTRIHVLLVGPPGSGKTEILLWLNRKLGAYFVNAEHASKVGLAGDARGKEVTPGALAEAHGSVMCIDELDKMSPKDQDALLQAMEEGRYTIIKGKHRETFRAEVRVVAAANDMNKISRPLLDRFDFVFQLRTPTKEERAKNVDVLVDSFFGMLETPKERVLIEYLYWIKPFEPKVTPEEASKIKEVLRSYLKLSNVDVESKSYRSLELSILRIAYALAKLEKKDITAEHVVRAIKLKDGITEEQYKYLMAIAKGLI